jgi:hypothetical protein
MRMTEIQVNRCATDACEEIEEIITEAIEWTDDRHQRFIIACQIAAHLFGVCGALFIQTPGNAEADRRDATDAVLKHVAELAVPPASA